MSLNGETAQMYHCRWFALRTSVMVIFRSRFIKKRLLFREDSSGSQSPAPRRLSTGYIIRSPSDFFNSIWFSDSEAGCHYKAELVCYFLLTTYVCDSLSGQLHFRPFGKYIPKHCKLDRRAMANSNCILHGRVTPVRQLVARDAFAGPVYSHIARRAVFQLSPRATSAR